MCGFAGFINLDHKPLDGVVLKNMIDTQIHRGPDDQGMVGFSLFENPKVEVIEHPGVTNSQLHAGIGFNRLSILDLSIQGHQPMISECGNVIISYNGETYNAFKYRDELLSKGYKLKSRTDTEILLYLYIEYGIEGMLKRLNGMFAFSIVDLKKSKMFLVRDHLGIKPLYIYRKNNTMLFSSEVKSFTKHPDFKAEINENGIDEYLLFRYCAHDRSLFRDVEQVPPAHYYEISKEQISLKRYWAPSDTKESSLNLQDSIDKLDDILKNSIKSQLLSDVKVGCQLSGGIDSSLVTSYARDFFDANMDTFSIVFSDEAYSEEQWVNYVTNITSSDSHRFQYSNKYAFENFQKATWHLDQPISIPNTLGIKRLAERSRENVTVLLSGEGADELFGGYSRFHDLSCRANTNIKGYSKLPYVGDKLQNKYLTKYSLEDFFILSSSALDAKTFKKFSRNGSIEDVVALRKELYPKEGNLIKKASMYDMQTYMVDLLNRQDKMTMAHSVENRVPFLDRDVVELVMSLPSEYLVKKCKDLRKINQANNYTKFILKELAVKRFNRDFVYRKKSGFPLPVKDLYFNTGMKEQIQDVILPGIKNRGVFDYKEVSKIWNKGQERLNNSNLKNLWMFFAFEVWAQTFIDSK